MFDFGVGAEDDIDAVGFGPALQGGVDLVECGRGERPLDMRSDLGVLLWCGKKLNERVSYGFFCTIDDE